MQLLEINLNESLPIEKGKYIIKTKTRFNTPIFEAYFNGKSFEVNNQIVTHWFKKIN